MREWEGALRVETRQALMLLVSERIGWFMAPCEMLYGALVAMVLPAVRQPGEFIVALSQFGFLLLLFLAGLEVDFTLMRPSSARPSSLCWRGRCYHAPSGSQRWYLSPCAGPRDMAGAA